MEHYIYMLRPAREGLVDQTTPAEEAVLEAHFAYLQAALRDGRLLLAGPCTDGAFGIVVLRTGSYDAAEEFMRSDPAVRGALMTAELHPFRVSLLASGT